MASLVLQSACHGPGRGGVGQASTPRATRRTVLAGIAAALAPGSQAALAQRGATRRLGVLSVLDAADPTTKATDTALVDGLSTLGWKDGGNLRIDWRHAGGSPELVARFAAELVNLAPDVLLATGTLCVEQLRRLTHTIPTVFVAITDPMGQGFVANLARPGGNITGFTDFDSPMAGEWLEMISQQIAPPAVHVSVLYNPETAPFADLMLRAIQDATKQVAAEIRAAPVRDETEIAAAIEKLSQEERGGLLVLPDSFTLVHRAVIVATTARNRVPAVYWNSAFITEGGLMSYGVVQPDLFRSSARYIDRILRGANPGDLPVQNPTTYEMVINLKTARVLGITIDPSLVAGADQVIE